MAAMPRTRQRKPESGVRVVDRSTEHRTPNAEHPTPPPVRRGLWWVAALALLIAVGVRLASAPAVRQWRYERQPVEALQAALGQRPGDAVLRMTLGQKLLAAGRASEAVEAFRRAAALEPQSAEALAGMGRALAASGRDDDAFAALQLSLARRPTTEALRAEGQLYLAHQVPEKAIPVLVRATQLSPEGPQSWRLLAVARAAAGQWAAAEAAWARVGALRPDDPAVLTGRAEALIQLGRPAEAEPLLRGALKREPGSAAAYTLLGSALAAREPAERFAPPAETAFRAALRLDPAAPDAAYGLGLLLLREGRSREALALFGDLARRAPDSLRARFQYARALRAAGQNGDADAALRDYHRRAEASRLEMELRGRLTVQPNNPVLRARLARLLRTGENAKERNGE
jgi:predicted Zn-dependent protease